MKANIKTAIIAGIVVTAFSINLINLNDVTLGLTIFILSQYFLVSLMFFGHKFSWWIFIIIYGLLSVLLFIYNFYLGNGHSINYIIELIITIGVVLIAFKRDLREAYLKRKSAS